jgi:hypothetical protein
MTGKYETIVNWRALDRIEMRNMKSFLPHQLASSVALTLYGLHVSIGREEGTAKVIWREGELG